jgi:enoyl-CoA hydratase
MSHEDVLYSVEGPVARVTLNRPRYRNAQSWRLLDALDAALDRAMDDTPVKVVDMEAQGVADRTGLRFYEAFRKYNLDLTLKWRNLPKPTIAMVQGYCIFGGWMIAAAMDVIFASPDARFLAGLVEYFSIPWDVPPRKAKELLFESRFIDAEEARALGFVNRVIPAEALEAETLAYARRVAENGRTLLRMAKLATNKAQDIQGYSAAPGAVKASAASARSTWPCAANAASAPARRTPRTRVGP